MHWRNVHPYVGGDIRIRDPQQGTTFQIGLGAALISELGAPPVRIVINYLKGHDPRGQFYNEQVEKWMLGLEL